MASEAGIWNLSLLNCIGCCIGPGPCFHTALRTVAISCACVQASACQQTLLSLSACQTIPLPTFFPQICSFPISENQTHLFPVALAKKQTKKTKQPSLTWRPTVGMLCCLNPLKYTPSIGHVSLLLYPLSILNHEIQNPPDCSPCHLPASVCPQIL